MVASNRQPSGSKPGPAAVHTHPAHSAGMPDNGRVSSRSEGHSGEKGVASHGTPKPVGGSKKNPLR